MIISADAIVTANVAGTAAFITIATANVPQPQQGQGIPGGGAQGASPQVPVSGQGGVFGIARASCTPVTGVASGATVFFQLVTDTGVVIGSNSVLNTGAAAGTLPGIVVEGIIPAGIRTVSLQMNTPVGTTLQASATQPTILEIDLNTT